MLSNILTTSTRSQLRLPQRLSMKILHNPIKLRFRQRGIHEVRKHMSLVRSDVLLVTSVSSLPLQRVSHVPAVRRYEDIALLADDVVYRSHDRGFLGEGFELAG